jgi:Leucine-rich repeat (LRR) protein
MVVVISQPQPSRKMNLDSSADDHSIESILDPTKLHGKGIRVTVKSKGVGITEHVRSIKVAWGAGVRHQMNNDEDYITSSGLHKKSDILSILEAIWKLPQVEVLNIVSFPYNKLPKEIGNMKSLKSLTLDCCERLVEVPKEASFLESLALLRIRACDSLVTLPPEIGELRSLEELDLCGNHMFQTLPPEIGNLRKLRSLRVEDSDSLESLPAAIGKLENISKFAIYRCPSLRSIPAEIGQLRRVEDFTLMGLPELTTTLPAALSTSLKFLYLGDCPRLTTASLEKLFSQELPHLKEVRLNSCYGLETLPHELKHIKYLKRLALNGLQRDTLLDFYSSPWNGETSSLKAIRLHGTSLQLGRSYGNVLSGLPDSLVELSLDFHDIDTLNGFVSNPLPKSIRNLYLDFNPILESSDAHDRACLEQMLQAHPQLGRICRYMSRVKLFTAATMHLMLFNRCGRALLGGSHAKPIPLSIWPTVLERVKGKTRSESSCITENGQGGALNIEASVLYSLLQGPAFVGRCPSSYEFASPGNLKRKVDLV